MGKSKLIFIFSLGYPQPPQGRLRGDAGGQEEGLTHIPQKYMCYVNSGDFNSGDFKNDLHFHFLTPQPPQGRPQGRGLGGLQGVLSPILPNIMSYVNSWHSWKGGLK